MAWFKKPWFWVTVRTLSAPVQGRTSHGGLVLGNVRVAEHFQAVWVALARQQLRRAFVNAFGMLAAQEAPMVAKELQ